MNSLGNIHELPFTDSIFFELPIRGILSLAAIRSPEVLQVSLRSRSNIESS